MSSLASLLVDGYVLPLYFKVRYNSLVVLFGCLDSHYLQYVCADLLHRIPMLNTLGVLAPEPLLKSLSHWSMNPIVRLIVADSGLRYRWSASIVTSYCCNQGLVP